MVRKKKLSRKVVAKIHGYRSGLELDIANDLAKDGIDGEYEKHIITYTKPETKHKYHPDFRLPNGVFVETKGRFLTADRKKHQLIKAQHPELDIRLLFSNSKAKISKGSKTTYADWCIKNDIIYADKTIPAEWFR